MTKFEIGSLFASFGMIIIVLTSIWFARKQFKISIKPILNIHIDRHADNQISDKKTTTKITITAALQNNGLGTAIIKKVSLFHNNNRVETDDPMKVIADKIVANCSVKSENSTFFTFGKKEIGLLSGDSITLIKMQFSDDLNEADEKMIERFNIEIDYESLEGDKYTYQSK